jgi:cell volume regulation protein A
MTEPITSTPQIILIAGALFFLSVLTNRVSERFGVPALLMFLAVGMLAGSEGIGGIYFDSPAVANFVGVFALAYILFSGGLDTDWRAVRPVMWRALTLSTLGVGATAALVGLFAWRLLGVTLKEGMLLGAIVSSTDAAAVFALMRARGVGLKRLLKPLLELESGSNDPMAVFLTMAAIGTIVDPAARLAHLLPRLLVNMSCGAAIGVVVGLMASFALNRLRLEYEGLYPVLSMSIVLLAYGLAEMLRGNGFISVYACGIVMGNKEFLYKRYLTHFHEGLAWLMQIILFLVLGLLVFPSRLLQVAVPAMLVSAFLMCVARPAAVYMGLWRSGFTMPERTLVAWTGLRGAVPIVLATFPFQAGYRHSDTMFNIVFFIVLTSLLLQGKTFMTVARWLGVDKPLPARPRYPIEFEWRPGMYSRTREIDISPDAAVVGRRVSELGLPAGVLILLIRRGQGFIVPKGQTRIEAFDTLMCMANGKDLQAAQLVLAAPGPQAEGGGA